MAQEIGDAKIRIVIDRSQARREAEQQEREGRRRREQDERPVAPVPTQPRFRRPRPESAAEERRPVIPGLVTPSEVTGAGRRALQQIKADIKGSRAMAGAQAFVASIPGLELFGAAASIALLNEEFGPMASGVAQGIVPTEAGKQAVRAAFGAADTVLLQDQIRELRSRIEAISETQAQLTDLAIGRVIASNEPSAARMADMGGLARAFYDVNSATRKMERDKKMRTRESVGEALGSGLRQLFEGAMGGQ